jgi:EAL domain-containing protein (putative c-di-GMP-specific phosphodiesterase class I)
VDRNQGREQYQRQRSCSALAEKLHTALHQDRLLFAFQPVVCAATGKVDYFECLLRMRDEVGQIVSVSDFIKAVEHLGSIGLIDRFVLEKTVRELDTHPDVTLGFNVSALTACDRPWLRLLMSVLRNRPELAPRLVVEITETAALYDIEEIARFVDTLRHAGCRVALDDFGAGHTTLRHLQTLAVDIVKIDGSFIQNLPPPSAEPNQGLRPQHGCRVCRERGRRGAATRRGYRLPPGLPYWGTDNRTPLACGTTHRDKRTIRRRRPGYPRAGSQAAGCRA